MPLRPATAASCRRRPAASGNRSMALVAFEFDGTARTVTCVSEQPEHAPARAIGCRDVVVLACHRNRTGRCSAVLQPG